MELAKVTRPIIMLTIIYLLVSVSSANIVDFCVADYNYPMGPAGFPCKNPANVTVDDFVYSGLGTARNTSQNIFKVAATSAIDRTFPGINGLGISMDRLDVGVGGVVGLHTHRSSELNVINDGTLFAGFIASDNKAYVKTLNKGDIMIVPPSLLHFLINVGDIPAVIFATLDGGANHNFQSTSTSLGANDIPTEILEKVTLLDRQQVKKLKNIFGGTN